MNNVMKSIYILALYYSYKHGWKSSKVGAAYCNLQNFPVIEYSKILNGFYRFE